MGLTLLTPLIGSLLQGWILAAIFLIGLLAFVLYDGYIIFAKRPSKVDDIVVERPRNPADRKTVENAERQCAFILDNWHRLHGVVEPEKPKRLLRQAVADLARLFCDRAELRTTAEGLQLAQSDLPDGHPLHDQLRSRDHLLCERISRLEADIQRRQDRLTTLVKACQQFIKYQEAIERLAEAEKLAQHAVDQADAVLQDALVYELAPHADLDPTADLAERADAIVTAYRELTSDIEPSP